MYCLWIWWPSIHVLQKLQYFLADFVNKKVLLYSLHFLVRKNNQYVFLHIIAIFDDVRWNWFWNPFCILDLKAIKILIPLNSSVFETGNIKFSIILINLKNTESTEFQGFEYIGSSNSLIVCSYSVYILQVCLYLKYIMKISSKSQ